MLGAAAAGGALVIGFRPLPAAGAGTRTAATNPFEAYLRIAPDGTVTVLAAHMEGGQGSHVGAATLVAEELDADWTQMRVAGAAGNTAAYGNLAWGGTAQGTGGSTAMASSWERYRIAGASARFMLVMAAARLWNVAAEEIEVAAGVLSHASGRTANFGELAEQAAARPPPAPETLTLKAPDAWTYIGRDRLPRLDTAAKTTGEATYTIDLMLPEMLTAVLARPPRFGASLRRLDDAQARRTRGVVDVVATPRGVAVVATDTWSAMKGRDALELEWDDREAERRGSRDLAEAYRRLARDPNAVAAIAAADGDPDAGLAKAAQRMEAEFEFPYLAHAAMEPLNAVARYRGQVLEIWAGHQLPDLYQQTAAELMGLPPERVQLHVMPTGGFFGRRATPDADVVAEAVHIVKSLGTERPIKVQWTREDDTRGGRYRPLYHHRVQAGLDAAGRPIAWAHRIVGQSILTGTMFEQALVHEGIDETSVEGAKDLPYAIPNRRLELVSTRVGVPVLWWRSVGHSHNAYVVETLIDDLAAAAGRDPLAFRRSLLRGRRRHLRVLDAVAEQAGWGRALPAGQGRGIAVHESFGTLVAQVAEVTVLAGQPQVKRVICAVDCGTAVNPDVVRAQMEGGIGYGLSAVLHGAITLSGGAVEQSNFHDYRCLRIDEMPAVDVHILPSTAPPSGVGEPGVPPIGPALSNAILAATGKRIRRLPIADQLAGTESP